MFKFPKIVLAIAIGLSFASAFAQSTKYPGVGRDATIKEAKCAQCHGIFGESNEVFSPLIGGTTAEDIKTGRVANLTRTDFPGRTTIMKVATVSTLWDYINRAMPWTSPKTLTTEEVYAVTGFLLNLAGVVPDDFVLSNKNIAEVQKRMPNRNGMTTAHAMWPGKEFGGTNKPDTQNTICMKDCKPEAKVASFLPDFARNAHGNLSEQNRLVGQQKGADTTKPEGSTGKTNPSVPAPSTSPATPTKAADSKADNKAVLALLSKNVCTACHGIDKKIVGPGFNDIAKKYPGKVDYIAGKIKSGGSGVWGAIPMPAQNLSDADAKLIAEWIANGSQK
jgi:cytochrome c551/c552